MFTLLWYAFSLLAGLSSDAADAGFAGLDAGLFVGAGAGSIALFLLARSATANVLLPLGVMFDASNKQARWLQHLVGRGAKPWPWPYNTIYQYGNITIMLHPKC